MELTFKPGRFGGIYIFRIMQLLPISSRLEGGSTDSRLPGVEEFAGQGQLDFPIYSQGTGR